MIFEVKMKIKNISLYLLLHFSITQICDIILPLCIQQAISERDILHLPIQAIPGYTIILS